MTRLALLGLLLLGLAGCATPAIGPVPTVIPTTVPGPGDSVGIANWSLRVVGVEQADGLPGLERPVGRWLVVLVERTNRGDASDWTPASAYTVTGSGRSYAHISIVYQSKYIRERERQAASPVPLIPLDRLIPPGTTVTTPLIFDIAPDAGRLELVVTRPLQPTAHIRLAA